MSLFSQYLNIIKNFFPIWSNLFIFLPYFFSVSQLLRTFFYPWKNIIVKKKGQGFSFSEWLSRTFANLFSSFIGATMRFSLLSFYLLLQIFLIIIFPFSFIVYLLISPLLLLFKKLTPDEQVKKLKLKKQFIEDHLIFEENLTAVEKWFEDYYKKEEEKREWWSLKNLFSYPPLARDWAYGYTYYLNQYAEELTSPLYLNRLTPVFDRENEINEIEKILSKSFEANILILGEEGVGKHAVIDALASRIYRGISHPKLAYHRILKINMEKILSQFNDQKQRENFFENLLEEAKEAKNIILLIDDIERYLSSNNVGFVDLSSIIEKYARRAEIQFIGITTPFLFERYIHPNERINRLFEKIYVKEISKEIALKIILNLVPFFEKKYGVIIPYETVLNLIEKSSYYFTEIPFPEKAINLLDEICSFSQTKKIRKIEPKLIDTIITQKTHIPTALTPYLKQKLINCETELKKNIFAQDKAIEQLSNALRRAFILLGKRKKPLASFLFLGPTGVGKTETAKTLAQYFFGSADLLIRFDMSLFQLKEDIPKLIGDIQTNNPGLLPQAIRKNPYGVLLLDEIEKANHDLLNIFLTILDEGYFTDGYGKKVNCQNLIIIATSNAGADLIYQKIKTEGGGNLEEEFQKKIIEHLITQKIFSPEFLNRFDGIVVYQPLDDKVILMVAKKFVEKLKEEIIKTYQIKINVTENYLKTLIKKAYTTEFGARQMERIIKENIEDEIAKNILADKIKPGEELIL